MPGFKAWGIHCGIKKTDKKDLAVIISDREAAVAGVFTKNRVKAASVLLNAAKVKSGKGQVIIANSGCANACTGKQGMADARQTAEIAARELGVKQDAVYVASTGVIGEFLPMQKLATGIATAAGLLSATGWEQAAEAIMTTDIHPKMSRCSGRDRRQDRHCGRHRQRLRHDPSQYGDHARVHRDRCQYSSAHAQKSAA